MKKTPILILLLLITIHLPAQMIKAYEYWVDDDHSAKVYTSISPVKDLHLQEALPVNMATPGFHTFNIRFADLNNNWSNQSSQFFVKNPPASYTSRAIIGYEYWIDDNSSTRFYQSIVPSMQYHLTDPLNLDVVPIGFHVLKIRFRDEVGNWSTPLTQYFTKFGTPRIIPNQAVAYRFWFDNDMSTLETLNLQPVATYTKWADTVETPFLTIGKHTINYMFKDSGQTFSSIRTDTFDVTSCLPHGGRTISGAVSVCAGQAGVVYSIRNIKNADSYTWSVPTGATIIAGSNTNSITIDFSMTTSPGDISVYATNACGDGATMILPITVYPATVAGVVTGGETIFFGMETNLTLEGNVGSVIKWQKRWNGGEWQDIANVTTAYTETPDTTGVWDYRAEVGSSPCSVLFSDFATVTVQPVSRTINLTLFLEGLFNPATSQMNKAQDESGDKFLGMIADQVQLHLAKPTYPFSPYYSVNNVDLNQDGTCSVTIPRSGNYYLVVKHRNSIETWSSNPVSLLPETISYDFSTTSAQAYGDNMKEFSGQWAIWTGDVNQDGIVDTGDMNPVENESMAVTMGYVVEDVNGDGIVDTGDMNIVENNSMAVIQVITP